jgi:hypothetical protein
MLKGGLRGRPTQAPAPYCALLVAFASLLAAAPADHGKLVRVPVWPDSAQGPALTVKDFVARLDGKPAQVVTAHSPEDDLMVLVVLDLSEEFDLADQAKQALIAAIDSLPGQARVALMRSQDGLQVLVDPTTDRARLADGVRALTVAGKAGLLDTVENTARIADSILHKADVRVAIVYVTDSDVHNYREDFANPVINSSDQHDMSRRFPEGLVREKISKLDRKLAASEAPLFVVHLRYRNDRLNEAYQTGLMQLASTTGGASLFCRSMMEIPGAVASIFRTVASHYSLVLRLPERSSRIVQVQVENGGHALTYRNRFVFEK